MPRPDLWQHTTAPALHALIQAARDEDLGPDGLDVTSAVMIPEHATGRAVFHARQAGRLSGAALLPQIAEIYDPALKLEVRLRDGDALAPGDAIAAVEGPLRSLLAFERVALNFMTHLSGIASLTARFVEAAAGTKARILDTRKTIPGLRALQKFAVTCGGGTNHRTGLYDAVLVKDNHLAHLPAGQLEQTLAAAIREARARYAGLGFVEVEVDRLDQLEPVLAAGPDVVLLDNMGPPALREAVAMRNDACRSSRWVLLEASGGVSLASAAAVAATGVDRIAIGALTHSAPSLDIGLDIAAG